MTEDERLGDLIELIERADMVVLHYGEKKAALGRDMQGAIISAMKISREVRRYMTDEETPEDPPSSAN